MIEQILSEIGEDKHQNFTTTSNKFKSDLWKFFLKPNFSSMTAIEFGTHKGQTTRVLSHLFKKVITVNIDWAHLKSAIAFNADLKNIKYVPFDLYKNEFTVKPVDDVIDVFFIDAGHSADELELDMARAMHMTLGNEVYFVFDDYGMMEGVRKVIDMYVDSNLLTIVEHIGHEAGYSFGGIPERVLKDSEGVICKLNKENIEYE